jgi:ppGpp synthetase/RelA/SpoT-type nucleotidyltranferase
MEKGETVAAFDFVAHRLAATESYQRVRSDYERFAETVRAILTEAFIRAGIKVASIEARAKSVDSFAEKAALPGDDDESRPKYANPMAEITDLAGVRVITFFPSTLAIVGNILKAEFVIREKIDKGDRLVREDRVGYQSLHYLIELRPNRVALAEYQRFQGLVAEIQVRTILQHAWAEIEHDIQYKSVETIPTPIRRRFIALAGLLEIADREFQAIQTEDERLREEARRAVESGRYKEVEITPDALRAYLDRKLGADGRMREWSYQATASALRKFGFTNFQQLEDCLAGYNDDEVSRRLYGSRQGQLTRFEDMLLAAMGEAFIERHRMSTLPWWTEWKQGTLERIRRAGIPVR